MNRRYALTHLSYKNLQKETLRHPAKLHNIVEYISSIVCIILTFPGTCPLFLSCLLRLNYVENSLLQYSSHLKLITCVARNTSYKK